MEQYEKNFDKIANKSANALNKIESGANKLYIGCATVFANLFLMGFCLWGVYAANTAYRLEQNGEVVQGEVVRLEESSSTEGGCCVYSPVIEFEVNGQAYSFESSNASYPPAYEVGERVEIIYDPANPNTAQINKWHERWLFPIIIIPAMILTSIILTFMMIRAWRRGENVIDAL